MLGELVGMAEVVLPHIANLVEFISPLSSRASSGYMLIPVLRGAWTVSLAASSNGVLIVRMMRCARWAVSSTRVEASRGGADDLPH